jgi:acetolactate synthase-1/3 small subunit
MENKTFTISVYSENNVIYLNIEYSETHINILSLNVPESEIENVSDSSVVIIQKNGFKYVGQIEKQIEVIKAFIILMKKRFFRKCIIQNRIELILMKSKFKI